MKVKNMFSRILIFGAIGSGKTTLAKKISKETHLQYYSLDNLIYKKFWIVRNRPSLRDKKLKKIIKEKSWILEGVNVKDWIIPAVKRADLIVILNLPRIVLIRRIIFRYIQNRFDKLSKKKGSFKDMLNLIKYSWLYKNNGFKIHLDMAKKYNKRYILIKSIFGTSRIYNLILKKYQTSDKI